MRKMMLRAIVFSMLVAGPAHAGLIMKQVQSSGDADGQRTRTVSEMRIEGGKARIDLIEMTENPFIQQGAYMLVLDEETMYVVNPKDRTYSRMDLEEMQDMGRMAAQSEEQMHRLGGSISVEDLKISKKMDEPGPAMLGFPTEHVVYDVTYTRPTGMQSGPMTIKMRNHETYEIWATRDLEKELSGAAALKKRGPGMGFSGGSSALAQVAEALSRHGMALKMIQTTESKINLPGINMLLGRSGGSSQSSKTTTEVTELRKASLEPDLFKVPKGYTEIDMANPNAGGMPNLDQIPAGGGPSGGPGGPSTPPMPDLDKMPK
jgi:hypothetical protein